MRPQLDGKVDDEAPRSAKVTAYDERHLITYLRLRDAQAQDRDWREAARLIVRRDPSRNADGAKRCWESHLVRWMSDEGYRQLLK